MTALSNKSERREHTWGKDPLVKDASYYPHCHRYVWSWKGKGRINSRRRKGIQAERAASCTSVSTTRGILVCQTGNGWRKAPRHNSRPSRLYPAEHHQRRCLSRPYHRLVHIRSNHKRQSASTHTHHYVTDECEGKKRFKAAPIYCVQSTRSRHNFWFAGSLKF